MRKDLVLLSLGLAAVAFGRPSQPAVEFYKSGYGTTYHLRDCKLVGKDAKRVTDVNALKPCPVCHPIRNLRLCLPVLPARRS